MIKINGVIKQRNGIIVIWVGKETKRQIAIKIKQGYFIVRKKDLLIKVGNVHNHYLKINQSYFNHVVTNNNLLLREIIKLLDDVLLLVGRAKGDDHYLDVLFKGEIHSMKVGEIT